MLGGGSFPVIFVYFRSAPELNISSGIMRFSCVVLLVLSGDVIHRRPRFDLPRFAPRRLVLRPAPRVDGRGAGGAACLLCDVVACGALLLRIGWRRDGACGFLGWGCGWRVMRCLLDVVRAADEMMRCSCPCVPSSFFSFRPAPSPRLFPICLLDLIPRPPGRGRRGRMSICGCGRLVGLLACHCLYAALSLIARSLFSSICGRVFRFVRGCVVVSVVVSSCIRYRMM